ncbi:phage/plasmid primase, P4 family protein [Halorubrum coriense DSM 10284]|uniref:Phage/plasmid primase, P4 family protein n=1 Tax=Halorubrum coriense DSM 10284 TaxID=1227466 RepID=M0EJD1_9EURY|nr:DUF5906 domain-containing protein [Halorubrum coriense]ELZ47891.1 phage/plasmid primase, P4 family protein [Halorubrum coriense DSM 10284]
MSRYHTNTSTEQATIDAFADANRLMTDGGEPADDVEDVDTDFSGVEIPGAEDDALADRYSEHPDTPDDDDGDTDVDSHDRVNNVEEDALSDEEAEKIRARGEADGDDVVNDTDDGDGPNDDDGYIRNSDDLRVATARPLKSRFEHNKEGKWMCTICEAVVKSAHGAKTHFGRSHPDASADDVENAINRRGEPDDVDIDITKEDIEDLNDRDARVLRKHDLVIRVYTHQTGMGDDDWEWTFDLSVASDEKPEVRRPGVSGMNEVLEDVRMHRDTYSGASEALDGVAVGALIESETGGEPGDTFVTDTIGTVSEISDAHGGGCEIELDVSSEYVDGHADPLIRADARDDGEDDDDDDEHDPWRRAASRYAEARLQSSPITRADARDSVVDALQEETEWVAIRERSEPGNHYALHRWDEDEGWQDDASTYISEITARELGSKATDTEDGHYRSQLARRNYISQDEVNGGDTDDTLIPVANGTINVDEIELDGTDDEGRVHIDPDSVVVEDMDPDNYFLYRIQTEWDPENADIDAVRSWLKDIIRTQNERSVLYELVGHALYPGYPTDAFAIAVGTGGSGKSQVLEVIKKMIGGDNVGVRTLQQIESADFAAGKPIPEMRMNISTELSGEQIKSIDTLKAYSSGEETEVELKRENAYNSYNDATMIFASDSPPRFPSDQDGDALGRRFHPIEFPASYVPDPDPNDPLQLQERGKTVVEEELRAEERLKAMLYLGLDGLVRLLHDDGGGEPGITDKRSRQERINQYESFSDPAHDFARNALVPAPDDEHGIKAQHLKTAFDGFAEAKDHAGKQLSDLYDYISEMPQYPVVRDRSRDNPFDGRPTRYLGVGFSEKALDAWVPESIKHYYVDASDEGEGGPARETLKEIREDTELGRREGVKVKVTSSTGKTSYGRHEEGVLRDDEDTIRYYVQAPGISLEEGEWYVIRDVAALEEDGETKLQLIPGMSDVTRIERGTDDDQNDLDDDDDDGGDDVVNAASDVDSHDRDEETDMEELDEAIIDASDDSGEKSLAAIAGEVSADVDTDNLHVIKGRIEKLKNRGDIIVKGDNDDDTDVDSHDRVSDEIVEIVSQRLNKMAGRGAIKPRAHMSSLMYDFRGSESPAADEDDVEAAIQALRRSGTLIEHPAEDELFTVETGEVAE